MWLAPEDPGLSGGVGWQPESEWGLLQRARGWQWGHAQAGERVTRNSEPAESHSAAVEVMGLFHGQPRAHAWDSPSLLLLSALSRSAEVCAPESAPSGILSDTKCVLS